MDGGLEGVQEITKAREEHIVQHRRLASGTLCSRSQKQQPAAPTQSKTCARNRMSAQAELECPGRFGTESSCAGGGRRPRLAHPFETQPRWWPGSRPAELAHLLLHWRPLGDRRKDRLHPLQAGPNSPTTPPARPLLSSRWRGRMGVSKAGRVASGCQGAPFKPING